VVVFRTLIACDTFSDVLNLYYVVRSTDFIYRYVKLDVCWVGRPISSVGANIFRANFTCMLFDVDAVISSFI